MLPNPSNENIQHLETFIAGTYEYGYQYKYFSPNSINAQWSWTDITINTQLERTARYLGELNAFARFIPNIDWFIHLHIIKEAVDSSKIEGTQTHIEDVFQRFEDIAFEKRDDWQEVQNYIQALKFSLQRIKELPISTRLLREIHALLLDGVRGKYKLPGEFRVTQNWIGGNSLSNATFVPPCPEKVADLMSDMERFVHNENIEVPHLIKIALIHYQFETIHPFLDGNGRLGRLLIPIYLVYSGYLAEPLLYLSDYFERNRGIYYRKLQDVRDENKLVEWVLYFLEAVEETTKLAVVRLQEIQRLKLSCEHQIMQCGKRTQRCAQLLEYLFNKPILNTKDVELFFGITPKAANELIQIFENLNIIQETTGQHRNRIFVFKQFLSIMQ